MTSNAIHQSHDISAHLAATTPLPRGLYRASEAYLTHCRPEGNDLEFELSGDRFRASLWRGELEVLAYYADRGGWYRVSTSGTKLPVSEIQPHALDMTPPPGPSWQQIMFCHNAATRVAASLLALSLARLSAATLATL